MHPEFIKIGNFVIYWYGVMVAIGIFVSCFIFQKISLKNGYSENITSKLLLWLIFWSIIGARVLHILVHFPYYYGHPLDIIKIRNGGLAIEGGIIAGLLFIVIFCKINHLKTIEILDLVALVVPLGQAIGRIGCFLNGCCYGKKTDFIFGVKFPHLSYKVHPTQLYYSFSYFIFFLFLWLLYKKKVKDGIIFSSYLLFFSLLRYLMDFLRGDLKGTFLFLYPTQLIAIPIFFLGGILFMLFLQRKENMDGEIGV